MSGRFGKLPDPRGGGGTAFRSRMGLGGNATNEGLTNTHLALMTAFGEEVDEPTQTQEHQECQREGDDALKIVNRPGGHIFSEMVG